MAIKIKTLLLSCSLMSVAVTALAVGRGGDMAFHGTLIEPPVCTINDGNRIDVGFGDRLAINKVDGVHYRMPMHYQLTCEGNERGWALTLSLSGSSTEFDNAALATDKAGLGIRIYQNGRPFMPNSSLEIELNSRPTLEAVPVKAAGVALSEGAFEAWATLRADYQ